VVLLTEFGVSSLDSSTVLFFRIMLKFHVLDDTAENALSYLPIRLVIH
jgi:hypothetical protein